MPQLLLILPGSTELDEQGRIKGRLDVPLSTVGVEQVARMIGDLAGFAIRAIYCAPMACCDQTALALASSRRLKVHQLRGLTNLDHGLWHGKTIEEVRQTQPRVYRQWQENPETVCPPEGESLAALRRRARSALVKVLKKHKDGVIALIAPEPLASVCRSLTGLREPGDLWKAECDSGRWEVIDVELSGLRP
jgi:probable phosphoglycerate mutase